MCALPKHYLTPEEYLALERQAETKSEYLRGEVYAMAGASFVHTTIAANTIVALTPQLKHRSCSAHSSDLRVKVRATGLQTYPDIVVICGQPQFEDQHRDTVLNPVDIFEILSRSTEAYDRGAKFAHYRRLESLTDYILISQNSPMLEHYARQPDGRWMLSTYQGLETVAVISSIGCELPLSEIYDLVEWTEDDAAITALRLVRDPAARYESEGGVYADRPGPPDLNR